MIKAVILDFGGVLFINKPKEEWLGSVGKLDVSDELWDQGRLGQVGDKVIFDELAKNYGEDVKTVRNWLFSRRKPNKELLDLLSELKPDVKKAVINNGLKTLLYGYLQRNTLPVQFDALICSAEEGVTKPDPKIFLDTCQKLGVKPEECLFVDDAQINLDGAKNLGMEIILFENTQILSEKLKKLDLLD